MDYSHPNDVPLDWVLVDRFLSGLVDLETFVFNTPDFWQHSICVKIEVMKTRPYDNRHKRTMLKGLAAWLPELPHDNKILEPDTSHFKIDRPELPRVEPVLKNELKPDPFEEYNTKYNLEEP